MHSYECGTCKGARLNRSAMNVLFRDKKITDFTGMQVVLLHFMRVVNRGLLEFS